MLKSRGASWSAVILIALATFAGLATAQSTPPTTQPAAFDYDHSAPPTVKAGEKKTGPNYRTESLTITPKGGLDIPAVLCLPLKGNGPFPVVLAIHGAYDDRKENMMRLFAAQLTRNGFACLVFDLPGHGGRIRQDKTGFRPALGKFLLSVAVERGLPIGDLIPGAADGGKQASPDTLLTVCQGLSSCVIESREMLDYLQTRPDLDSKHIAVEGVSLGGTIAVLLTGTDPRVKAAVVNIAGAWTGMADRCKGDEKLLVAWTRVDPTTRAPLIAPRPVFMTNGRKDPLITKENSDELAAAMHIPDVLHYYDGGHSVSAHAVDDGLEFLCKAFDLPKPLPRPASAKPAAKPVAGK